MEAVNVVVSDRKASGMFNFSGGIGVRNPRLTGRPRRRHGAVVISALSPHLFWDVDRSGVDVEQHAAWLVRRVLEYGTWADWVRLEEHYGRDRLARIVVTIRSLDPKARTFCQARFDLPANAFRCLRHDYPLLAQPEVLEGIRMLSVLDVAAMKLNAIVNRGAKKDFYDLHTLLRHYPLPTLLDAYRRKYPNAEPFLLVRSLSFFEDAESEPDPVPLAGQSWPDVKDRVIRAVREYPSRGLE